MSHAPGNNTPDPIFEQIDAYLDNALSPADRAAFEARLAADEPLRAELDLARGIESSLKRTHIPTDIPAPALPRATSSTPAKAAASKLSGLRLYWPVVAAAALLFVAITAYQLYTRIDWKFRRYDAAEFYALASRDNFTPDWVCRNDREFKEATGYSTGQQMLVRQDSPAKIDLVGWAYSKKFSGTPLRSSTTVLFAKVDDVPVVVLVDLLENDRKVRPGDDPSVHIFRRQLGASVLYEITPRPAPGVIDAFYLPPEE